MTNNNAFQKSEAKEIKVLGIDLAKQSFQLYGVDAAGHKVINKKFSRKQLSAFIAQLPPFLIGLEACGEGSSLGTPV